ncbi:hypothetical protein M0805_002173 [Coniferiporia weirii]|nr:hypothetical protein M0805_002173 [Coniferiporia weirii]
MSNNFSSSSSLDVTIGRLYALRYLTTSGLAVFVYDFLLTFPDEVHLIWSPILWRICQSGKSAAWLSRPTFLYLIARYAMFTIGILYLSDLIPSRNLTTNWVRCRFQMRPEDNYFRCQGSAVFVFGIDVIVEALSCGVVLHRLFVLWDFSPVISRIVLSVFSFAKVVMFSFAGLAIALTKDDLSFYTIDNLRFCGVSGSSRFFLGVWVTCVAFDIFAFALLLLNALSRPRSVSQRLLKILYEDGVIFFLTIFSTPHPCSKYELSLTPSPAMRSLNLIISAAAPPSLIILGIVFPASMVSTVVSRSFLRLQAHVRQDSAKMRCADGDSVVDDENGGYALQSTVHMLVEKHVTRSTESGV